MTDYIVETDKGIICEYVDDGRNEAVLITPAASVLSRPYREPPIIKKLLRELSQFVPRR